MTCHICDALKQDTAARDGSLVCNRHFERIWELLREVAEMHDMISDDEYLLTTREPASFYTKSLPPCSLDVLSMTDDRTKYTRKGDPVSARRVLGAWCAAVADARGERAWRMPQQTLYRRYEAKDSVVLRTRFLQARLYWIVAQPAVTRFATHVACVHDSLRRRLPSDQQQEDQL